MSFCSLIFIIITSCNTSNKQNKENDRWWTETDQELIISELNRTTEALRKEIENLSPDQWNFKESNGRWSIAEIVEHLEMQNQLHYREISVISNSPQYLKYRSLTENRDDYFIKYATDTIKGQASWFLEPLGRFCTKEEGQNAFYRARKKLTEFVEETGIDLRKQFTFRAPVEGIEVSQLKIGKVRDLHQLLLTGIAHTDRHLSQIGKIKQHPKYPRLE